MKTIVLQKESVHAGNLILVNKQHPYREGAIHHRLSPVNDIEPTILLNRHVVKLLSKLMDKLDGWKHIYAVSGWRSVRVQQDIYTQSLQDNGSAFTKMFVALPGHSEHHTGYAIDLGLRQDHVDFICPEFPYTGICQTFRQKAISYGLIERYPQDKESITGIAHEPWHFRYVGSPHAKIMQKHDLVLEEYIDFLKQYRYREKHYFYGDKQLNVSVSYLQADEIQATQFEIDDNVSYSVSGNNIDGYIITEWR